MNIESFIKKEAPKKDIHDMTYAVALRSVHNTYKNMPLTELKEWQIVARKQYNSTHNSTAACMILFSLIKEKEKKNER